MRLGIREAIWLSGLVLLISLHFWFPDIGRGTSHDTYSATADGKKAFFLLVRKELGSAVRNTRMLSDFVRRLRTSDRPYGVICLLGPARYPTPAEWNQLLEWVYDGGAVVLAAREDAGDLSVDSLGIQIKPIGDGTAPRAGLGRKSGVETSLVASDELLWESPWVVDAPQAQSLVAYDGTPQAVVQSYGSGKIVVVASDFIFSNRSVAWKDNSVLALRLLETAESSNRIYFDESLNRTGTPKAVGLLFDPLFRPITVQIFIGLLLFAWWQSRRFGPIQSEAVSARHNIVDHTDAVGILSYKSGDGTGALRAYLRQLIAELHLKHFKGREERILDPIARRLGQTSQSIRQRLRRASRAARAGRVSRREAAWFIRQLAILRRAARPQEYPKRHN